MVNSEYKDSMFIYYKQRKYFFKYSEPVSLMDYEIWVIYSLSVKS